MSNNVLMVGGTSSISEGISQELENMGYTIECSTYRNLEKIENSSRNWEKLDLYDLNSVKNFISTQSGKKYSKIVFVIANSASTLDGSLNLDIPALKTFFGDFIVNYMFLMKELIANLKEDGSMIYISSVAANMPYKDVVYSTGKAVMQCYALDISTHLSKNQSICAISTGTIYESEAYYTHSNDWLIENKDRLTSKKDIANLVDKSDLTYNGKVIKLGI